MTLLQINSPKWCETWKNVSIFHNVIKKINYYKLNMLKGHTKGSAKLKGRQDRQLPQAQKSVKFYFSLHAYTIQCH